MAASQAVTAQSDNPSLAQQALGVVLPPASRRLDIFGWLAAALFLCTITYFWQKMLDDVFEGIKQ